MTSTWCFGRAVAIVDPEIGGLQSSPMSSDEDHDLRQLHTVFGLLNYWLDGFFGSRHLLHP
jgi:hypothetical protein